MRKMLFILIIFFLNSAISHAHQPRIVSEDFTRIQNPEVSQAFYGVLDGQPEKFQISSDVPFKLYVSILVPELPGIGKDVSAEVKNNNEPVFMLDGLSQEWTFFYEEFAGDSYYEGPAREMDVIAGVYDITVFSPDNLGKYVLVVGRKETFPLAEQVNVIKTLPKLKKDFFEKSPLTAFFNLIGLYLLIVLLVILGIIALVFWLLKKTKYKKKRK